uniref:Uncharacterized protein n=1 Tax=Anguilla anguilla TaxID=7936 RepID=A0A0E9VX97_ANGAN
MSATISPSSMGRSFHSLLLELPFWAFLTGCTPLNLPLWACWTEPASLGLLDRTCLSGPSGPNLPLWAFWTGTNQLIETG